MSTFREICPNWHGVLFENKPAKYTDGEGKEKTLDIFNSETCVVGEAHGFSNKYYYSVVHEEKKTNCHDCTRLSMQFISYVQNYDHPLLKQYGKVIDREELIKTFEEHWNAKHIEDH